MISRRSSGVSLHKSTTGFTILVEDSDMLLPSEPPTPVNIRQPSETSPSSVPRLTAIPPSPFVDSQPRFPSINSFSSQTSESYIDSSRTSVASQQPVYDSARRPSDHSGFGCQAAFSFKAKPSASAAFSILGSQHSIPSNISVVKPRPIIKLQQSVHLTVHPVIVSVKELTCAARTNSSIGKGEKDLLLNRVSMIARPGQMVAIIGPSGEFVWVKGS